MIPERRDVHERKQRERDVLDVSRLATFAFGHQGLIWWGTVGFMVIEGSMFILVFITYFFLRTRESMWPPGVPLPDSTWGTVNTALMVASLIPNQMTKSAAERFDVPRTRALLLLCLALQAIAIVIRGFEFNSLGVRWDTNAYGSIVWVLLGLHASHLITDWIDSVVLAALIFTAHLEPKRLVDVSENALYWYFVVLSWLPIYVVIYFAPRWL
jgi:heme/copper-type cytochrome/quinol oxidase subunit 3